MAAPSRVPPGAGGGKPFLSGRRILVVCPAWNEEATLGRVVSEIGRHLPQADVLVVDDASTDATARVAAEAGVTVISNVFNLGVGGAVRVGFRYAAAHGYAVLVQIDADGQHDPGDAPALLDALIHTDRPAVVIGARFEAGEDFPVGRLRRWAMRLLAAYLSRLSGTRLTDATSGYRAYNRSAIELFSHSYPTDYLADTIESLVIASRAGARITQISTRMRPRAAGTPSQSRSRAVLYLARVSLMLFLEAIRPRARRVPPEEE